MSVPSLEHYMVVRSVTMRNSCYYKVDCKQPLYVEKRCRRVLDTVVQGQAKTLLLQEEGCGCGNPTPMGHCIYSFGNLMECSCEPLDRLQHDYRERYERNVLSIIRILLKERQSHDITLTIFGSGLLFSDFVVLVKVLKLLDEESWVGTLQVNLVDHNYTDPKPLEMRNQELLAIESDRLKHLADSRQFATFAAGGILATAGSGYYATKSEKKTVPALFSLFSAIGTGFAIYKALESQNEAEKLHEQQQKLFEGKKVRKISLADIHTSFKGDTRSSQAIPDFVNYLTAALSLGIKLSVQFFKNPEDYIDFCSVEPHLKSDLLIGCDMDDSAKDQENLRLNTQKDSPRALFLNKVGLSALPMLEYWEEGERKLSKDLSQSSLQKATKKTQKERQRLTPAS